MSRDYLQHGRRHKPGGTDPIPGLGTVEVAYYQINETTYDGSGNQAFTMDLTDTSDTDVFSINGDNAHIEPGVYSLVGKLNFGNVETFTTATTDFFTFGISTGTAADFTFLYDAVTLGITSAVPLNVVSVEFTHQFIADVAYEFRLHLVTPATTSRSLGDVGCYIERIRDHDWA